MLHRCGKEKNLNISVAPPCRTPGEMKQVRKGLPNHEETGRLGNIGWLAWGLHAGTHIFALAFPGISGRIHSARQHSQVARN